MGQQAVLEIRLSSAALLVALLQEVCQRPFAVESEEMRRHGLRRVLIPLAFHAVLGC